MARKKLNFKRSSGKSKLKRGIDKNKAKQMIRIALRAKGKGSVALVWRMARKAAKANNINLASSLGVIAKQKSAHAYKMKKDPFYRGEKSLQKGVKSIVG